MNDEHEMQALYEAEELISKVLYDLDPAIYTVTTCESTATGKPEDLATATLEVTPGSTFMRNAYRALDKLHEASIGLDGGYLILAKLRATRANSVEAVWVWHVMAGNLTPLRDDVAYDVILKVKGSWYVKKDVVHTAWKSKTPT